MVLITVSTLDNFTSIFTLVNIVQTTKQQIISGGRGERLWRNWNVGYQETKLTRIPVYQSGNYAHEIK